MAETKIKVQKEIYDFKLSFSIDKKVETQGSYSPDYRLLRTMDQGSFIFRCKSLEEAREFSRAFLSLLKLNKENGNKEK